MLKVSIIIPVYGVEKYIEKCARSVFEQTYSNIEVIFVDDCSPDNSISILKNTIKQYPDVKDKISILSYSKNRGLAGARKFGLEHASGDYVLQIDSDDYIDIRMVESMIIEVDKINADIVICDFNLVTDGKEQHLHVNPSLDPIECMKQILRMQVHGSVANKLIRRSLFTQHEIWPIEGLNMREDLSVMYRLLYYAKKLAYIPKPFYNYVLRAGSVSDGRMNPIQQRDAQNLLVEMDEFCAKEQVRDKDLLFAFYQFKAQIKIDILLFGNIKELRTDLYKGIRIQHYCSHPKLPVTYKIMGILSESHFVPLIWFCRKIVDFLMMLKK